MRFNELPDALRGALLVLAGAVVISVTPLFVNLVAAGPNTVACYRMLWGGLALLGMALMRGERIIPGRAMFITMLAASVFFAADLICWHQSILYVGPGLATILSNFQVFFLALYAVAVFRERPGLRLKLAIPLSLAGLWLLLDVDMGNMPPGVLYGVVTGVASAVFYTGYILTLRRSQSHAEHLPPFANMAVISLMTVIFTGAASLVSGESLVVRGLHDNLLLLLLGVGCQGIGWLLLSMGLPLLPASRAGLIMLAQPSLSLVWDIVFFGRPTSLTGYFGAAVALAAISLGVLDAPGKKKKPSSSRP